jgi:queuosine precursor transporter
MIQDPAKLSRHESLRFYTPLAMLFVALLVIVNIITQKIIALGGGLILTPGDVIYPFDYTLSVILTEVYGYAMSRRVIWCALACNIIIALIISLAITLPPAPHWHNQASFALILSNAQRIVLASFSAFVVGEFVGTYILAKIKVRTAGKYLWFRAASATLIGQAIDCVIFTLVAFAGILVTKDLLILLGTTYICKILFQLLLTPAIYALAGFLKQKEGVDIYDRNTNFNPFNLGLK